jgi:hypothetical protein
MVDRRRMPNETTMQQVERKPDAAVERLIQAELGLPPAGE